jgi:RNA polymerase sigma factor (sigma-70 family)
MAFLTSGSLVRQLESLFESGSLAALTDRQLLERFTAHRDAVGEAAFKALVDRHGPMVLGVCCQLLIDRHHAEDAFQAVFLILAQKSRTIRDPDLLGNWLYGVAIRTARCARLRLDRRRRKEGCSLECPRSLPLALTSVPPAEHDVVAREQVQALHDEIARLPRSFRLPVVLCYLEGLTVHEAAHRLRWPHGTVRSRLARAKDKLRRGLTRRGIVVPAIALSAVLETGQARAAVSTSLCDSTAKAAINFATGTAAVPAVALLARQVLRAMFVNKLKLGAMTCLLLVSVAAGAVFVGQARARQAGKPDLRPIAKGDDATAKPAPGRVFVVGHVLDPAGKPVAGAAIDLVARPRNIPMGASADDEPFVVLGSGSTDAGGRFHLDAPRTPSAGLLNHTGLVDFMILASARGFGLSYAGLNPDAERPEADLRLNPERLVHLKLVDLTGLPAANVEVRVQRIGQPTARGGWDGVSLWPNPPTGLRTWPRPMKTDALGKLVLSGIGENLTVSLGVHDTRYARQGLSVETGNRALAGDKETTLALEPAKIIEGSVLTADTGQPVPGAVIAVAASKNEIGSMVLLHFRADDQGRFVANPAPGSYFRVKAFPPEGQPYLVSEVEFPWTKGEVKRRIDVKLARGVLIRGKVTDDRTGRPLVGASVQFIMRGRRSGIVSGWQAAVATKDDGSYQMAVPPGKGHLFLFGPTPDFVLNEIGWRRLYEDQPGGERYYAHAIVPYEVQADDQPQEISAVLRCGVIVKGGALGPDGQTVTGASVISALRIVPTAPYWHGGYQIPVRDGRFELHGLAPDAATRFWIFDAERQWGTTVEVSGKQAGADLTIRLQPCGGARARVVDAGRKSVANYRVWFQFVATPGPPKFSRNTQHQAEFSADAEVMGNVDRLHYWHGPSTDAEGRLALPALIPGAVYRIEDRSSRVAGAQVRRDFSVKPGETLDLGDILIEKPE